MIKTTQLPLYSPTGLACAANSQHFQTPFKQRKTPPTFICTFHDVCITFVLLLQLLYLALAAPQLQPLFDGHVSQLLQLGPDVGSGVGLAAALTILYLRRHYCVVPRRPSVLSLSPCPAQTEQPQQRNCSAPHSAVSPV